MRPETRPLLALLMALALAGCERPGPPAESAEGAQVRVYSVPAGQTEALANALNEVLDAREGTPAIGRASARIPGQLVVLAPAGVHASVEHALEGLVGAPSAPAAAASTLRFWRVDVRPGPDRGLERLAGLEPALDALRRRFPGQGITLVEEISLAAPSPMGHSQLKTGNGGAVWVRALPDEVPTFDVEFSSPGEQGRRPVEFQSRLALSAGDTLVAATLDHGSGTDEGASVLLMRLEAATP